MSSPNPQPAAPVDQSPAACAAQLKQLFPALFSGGAKPLKLRIQADIQERAPGVFTKQMLSAFLRRYTGGTGYLIVLSKAQHRFDLDGQPAGELSQEHRDAAVQELARRRNLTETRRAEEEQQQRQRALLLHDFSRTTLTPANFCALKGIALEALEPLLEQAREEEKARRAAPPPARRPDPRGQRPGGPSGRDDRHGRPAPRRADQRPPKAKPDAQ